MASKYSTDIGIVGNGSVGKVAAIALAAQGLEVVLCGPTASAPDNRTTALLMDSVAYLERLGVWNAVSKHAHPLKTMRIVDGTNRLIRAPQVDFRASEINLEAFGYNVQNDEFTAELDRKISETDTITVVSATVTDIDTADEKYRITAKDGSKLLEIDCNFLVGADGRNSVVREHVNAGTKQWQYNQEAIVLDFEHQFPTRYTSTEIHTENGPFTIVPRTEHVAGLVWMDTAGKAEQTAAMHKDELAMVLEEKMQSFLGKVKVLTNVQTFPLKGLVAQKFGDNNWALVGEAAHVFPPIGAQGFNLGIRDIEALADTLGRFTGYENRGQRYDNTRKADINLRTLGVDLLNKSLTTSFLPFQILRSASFHAMSSFPFVRKMAMRQGISPNFRSTA